MGNYSRFVLKSARAIGFASSCAMACAIMTGPLAAAEKAKAGQGQGQAKPAAANPDDPAAMSKQAAEAARKSYDAGVKAYAAGRYDAAVQSLNAALRGNGLAGAEMARGLYYRGLSYKKQSKPGLAISDLTSALWLKNGLNDAERQSATAERAEAYRMAGLGEGAPIGETVSVANPNTPSAAATATPAPVPAAPAPQTAAARAEDTGVPQPLTMTADTPAPASAASRRTPAQEPLGIYSAVSSPMNEAGSQPSAAQPAAAVASTAASDAPIDQVAALDQARVTTSPAPARASAPVPAPIPASVAQAATAAPATSTTTTTTVSAVSPDAAQAAGFAPSATPAASTGSGLPGTLAGLFSNMFGGSTSAPPAVAADSVTTASTEPAPASSSWSGSTSVASGNAKSASAAKAVKVAAAPQADAATSQGALGAQAAQAAQPAKASAPKGGKYKVHIAAVRSRAEADALAQKLAMQYASALQSRSPTVDEAVIGSMGTFYRVRVGSYASPDEPRGLCTTLRNSGYDCLVVTN